MIQGVETSDDTKTCSKCGRVLPAVEFRSETLGLTSECTECVWERMCQVTEADLDNLDKKAAYQRSYEEGNLDFSRRGYRRYYGKNRDRMLERLHRRAAADPQHQGFFAQAEAGYVGFSARMRERRARRHGAGGWHGIEDVKRLYDEQGGRCFYCGKELQDKYELDHKTPLSRGGTEWPENLCCACELCNSRKQQRTAEEFTEYLNSLRRRP
jgi:5-methylcytosine-specific restriction endonuclease McrA